MKIWFLFVFHSWIKCYPPVTFQEAMKAVRMFVWKAKVERNAVGY